jgi:hypothetical protein
MKIMSWDSIFGPVTGVQNKRRSLKNATWNVVTEDVWFDGYVYAAGSQYKFWEGKDFGYVAFHPSSRTPNGMVPGKFLHKN